MKRRYIVYVLVVILLSVFYFGARINNITSNVLAQSQTYDNLVSYDDLRHMKSAGETVIQMQPIMPVDVQVPQNKRLHLIPPITGYDSGYSAAYIVRSKIPGAYLLTIHSATYKFESPEKANIMFSSIYIPEWADTRGDFLSPDLMKEMRKNGITWLVAKGVSPARHTVNYFVWLRWPNSPYVGNINIAAFSVDTGVLATIVHVGDKALDKISGEELSRLLVELLRKEGTLKKVINYSVANKIGDRWTNKLINRMLDKTLTDTLPPHAD